MPLDLEDRLEQLSDSLPSPPNEATARARTAAIRAVPSARRRRLALSIPAIAVAAVGLAALAVLAGPWRDSPFTTEKARAALGSQPILHLIAEYEPPNEVVVDVTTGKEIAVHATRHEYWFDAERNYLRVRLTVGGATLPGAEYLHTPEGFFTDLGRRPDVAPPRFDPGLERFARGYREALESGGAAIVGKEIVDGRNAVILRFSSPPGPDGEARVEEVAVDEDDYRPLRFRYLSGSAPATPWTRAARIVEIETIARDPRDFERPRADGPRPERITGTDERMLTPAEASPALGRPAFWPGQSVAGVELAEIKLVRVTTDWTDGRSTRSHALVFQYGADVRTAHTKSVRSLIITEATVPEAAASGSIRPVEDARNNELHLSGAGGGDGTVDVWFGSLRRDGLYLSFRSRERKLIVAAAMAMMPLE